MNKYRKEYCEENGRVKINPENTKLYDYIKHLENKLEQAEQLTLTDVSNCKRDETLELLEEIMTKVKEANEEVENGIYDPMLEVAKHILNNYKIERR